MPSLVIRTIMVGISKTIDIKRDHRLPLFTYMSK